jgi:hypothetical protein
MACGNSERRQGSRSYPQWTIRAPTQIDAPLEGARIWVMAELRDQNRMLHVVTNPIFLANDPRETPESVRS